MSESVSDAGAALDLTTGERAAVNLGTYHGSSAKDTTSSRSRFSTRDLAT